MDIKEITSKVDHTLLSTTATEKEVFELCDEAIRFNAASVCIPPCYVAAAKKYVGDKVKICTVIGFPNGYHTTEAKCFEAEDAIKNGADEIDMVINVARLKNGETDFVYDEICRLRRVCKDKVLKVIVETCLLSDEEKREMCELVTSAKADFIKTSTGFSSGGATLEDIRLFKEYVGENVKIKASGGIHTPEQAEEFIKMGADRIGASKVIKSLL